MDGYDKVVMDRLTKRANRTILMAFFFTLVKFAVCVLLIAAACKYIWG